jgi:hypothetical protein
MLTLYASPQSEAIDGKRAPSFGKTGLDVKKKRFIRGNDPDEEPLCHEVAADANKRKATATHFKASIGRQAEG